MRKREAEADAIQVQVFFLFFSGSSWKRNKTFHRRNSQRQPAMTRKWVEVERGGLPIYLLTFPQAGSSRLYARVVKDGKLGRQRDGRGGAGGPAPTRAHAGIREGGAERRCHPCTLNPFHPLPPPHPTSLIPIC